MLDWLLAIGIHLSNPEQLQQDFGYSAQIGVDKVYAWGTYDNPKYRNDLGSNFGSLGQIGVGLGTRWAFNDRINLTIQAGKIFTDLDPKPSIRNEYIRASLRNDFGTPPFTPTQYSYRLSNAWSASVGLEIALSERWIVNATYRAAKAKEKVDMWTGTRHSFELNEPDCRCWWQQTNSVDLSSFNIGIRFSL